MAAKIPTSQSDYLKRIAEALPDEDLDKALALIKTTWGSVVENEDGTVSASPYSAEAATIIQLICAIQAYQLNFCYKQKMMF